MYELGMSNTDGFAMLWQLLHVHYGTLSSVRVGR